MVEQLIVSHVVPSIDLRALAHGDALRINMIKRIAETALFEEQANERKLDLYQQLKKRKIPIDGIADEESSPSNQEEEHQFYKNEASRNRSKAEKTIAYISNVMDKNGIIILLTRPYRSRQLGAHLQDHWRQTNDLPPLTIKTINYQSQAAQDVADLISSIAMLIPPEEAAIQALIESLPYEEVTAKSTRSSRKVCLFIPGLEVCLKEFMELYMDNERLASQKSPLKAPGSGQSFLSPPESVSNTARGRSHNFLLQQIEKLPKEKKIIAAMKEKIIAAMKEGNYSLVLRHLCNLGETSLVRLLINASPELPIKFTEASTNGKTAADWFAKSKATEQDKIEIAEILAGEMSKEKISEPESWLFQVD